MQWSEDEEQKTQLTQYKYGKMALSIVFEIQTWNSPT